MKQLIGWVVLFAGAGSQGLAAEDVRAQLRQMPCLPQIHRVVLVRFSSVLGFTPSSDKRSLADRIERLQKELTGDAADAERYCELGALYEKARQPRRSRQAYDRAIALCREQMRRHPQSKQWLAPLGQALAGKGESQSAEALLRQAVREAPQDWRGWHALGNLLEEQLRPLIVGEDAWLLLEEGDVWRQLRKAQPTPRQIHTWEDHCREARECYSRAISASPQLPQLYLRRALLNGLHHLIQQELRAPAPSSKNLVQGLLCPDFIADFRAAASCPQSDSRIVAWAIILEIVASRDQLPPQQPSPAAREEAARDGDPLLVRLPQTVRPRVKPHLDRLKKMAAAKDRRVASDAAEALGFLAFQCKDRISCERWLHQTVVLDPDRELAWSLLSELLVSNDCLEEMTALLEKQLKVKDSPHLRFLLAGGYAEREQWERAEQTARAGLKLEPDHFLLQLSLAGLLLRKGDRVSLDQAGKLLDRLKERLDNGPWEEDRKDSYQTVETLWRGLTGSAEVARQSLQHMRERQVQNMAVLLKSAGARLKREDQLSGKPIIAVTLEDSLLNGYTLRRLWLLPRLQKLAIEPDGVTDDDLRYLGKLPALTHLRLCSSVLTDKGLLHLQGLKTLRSLCLHDADISDAGLAHLAALPALERLDLDGSSITDKGLEQLRSLPRLRELSLAKTRIEDAGLAHLRHVPELERLRLAERPADLLDDRGTVITDRGMAAVGKLKKLRSLSVVSRHLSSAGLAPLQGLVQLQELSLPGAAITDAGLAHLARLEQLRRLDVSGAPVTERGLDHLKGLAQLRELKLANTAVAETGLIHLQKLSRLRVLDLTCWPCPTGVAGARPRVATFTDAGFRYLEGLAGLECLLLDGRTVEARGLSRLGKLPRLRSLSLSYTGLGDADLAALGSLTQLERLELAGDAITDEGLKHLLRLRQLTFLNLSGVRVTEAGLEALYKAMPHVIIRRWE